MTSSKLLVLQAIGFVSNAAGLQTVSPIVMADGREPGKTKNRIAYEWDEPWNKKNILKEDGTKSGVVADITPGVSEVYGMIAIQPPFNVAGSSDFNPKIIHKDPIQSLGADFAAIPVWQKTDFGKVANGTPHTTDKYFTTPDPNLLAQAPDVGKLTYTAATNVLYEKTKSDEPLVVRGYGVQGSFNAIIHNRSMASASLPERTTSFKLTPATGNVRLYEMEEVVSVDFWAKWKAQFDSNDADSIAGKGKMLVPMIMTWQETTANGEFVENARNQIIICMENTTEQMNPEVRGSNSQAHQSTPDLLEIYFDGSTKGYMPKQNDGTRNYAGGWKVPHFSDFENAISNHNAAIIYTTRALQQKGIVTKEGSYIASEDDIHPVLRAEVAQELSWNANPIAMKRELYTYKLQTVVGWKANAANSGKLTTPIFATLMYVGGAMRFVTDTQAKRASSDSCSAFNVYFGVTISNVLPYVSNPTYNAGMDILFNTTSDRYNKVILPEYAESNMMVRIAPYVATWNQKTSDYEFGFKPKAMQEYMDEKDVGWTPATRRNFLDRNAVPLSMDNRNMLLKSMEVHVFERLNYCVNFLCGEKEFAKLPADQQESFRTGLFQDPFSTITFAENSHGKTCIRSPQYKMCTNISSKVGCNHSCEFRKTECAFFAMYSYSNKDEIEQYWDSDNYGIPHITAGSAEDVRMSKGFPTALHGPNDAPNVNPNETFYCSYEGYAGLNNSTCNADGGSRGCAIKCPSFETQKIAMGGTCGSGVADLGPIASDGSRMCSSMMDLSDKKLLGWVTFPIEKNCSTATSMIGKGICMPSLSYEEQSHNSKNLAAVRKVRGARILTYNMGNRLCQYQPQACDTQCCSECSYVMTYLSRVCEFAKPVTPCGGHCPTPAEERVLDLYNPDTYHQEANESTINLLDKIMRKKEGRN